jgi:hypothetical protein
MNLFLSILVMYGITFGIKDSQLLAKPRQQLADRSNFFYELFSCPYCVGFHSGWLTYLLLTPFSAFDLRFLVAFAFAGVPVSAFFELLLTTMESNLGLMKARAKAAKTKDAAS